LYVVIIATTNNNPYLTRLFSKGGFPPTDQDGKAKPLTIKVLNPT
jgi:hypothetical protein